MSSILQHRGRVIQRGVELLMYKTYKVEEISFYDVPYQEELRESSITFDEHAQVFNCHKCKGTHPVLYRIWRKPVGKWGNWVVFRWNNKEHVPDLSLPIGVEELPRDAKRLSYQEMEDVWHSE